jgi:hypothetical protein
MTEQPNPEHEQEPLSPEIEPGPAMPSWVPVVIGALLVVIAALAVFTGLRYRGETITSHVQPRTESRATSPAPPGEPGAGASLVFHGSEGDNTPAANEPVSGDSRAVITGGPGGVSSTVRIWARRGMVLDVQPETSMVYVNDVPIGEAAQFNTADEIYDFAASGSYTVKVVAPHGAHRTFIVTASDDAKDNVALIAAKLE